MAAGQGFKTFNTGDVLTASDVNGYLMQGVWVFADAAARTSAVTSPQEGNMSFLKDTNSLEYYSGSAWVAVDTTATIPAQIAGKNAIINGGMDIWQRGTSIGTTVLAAAYTADRWNTQSANDVTTSRQTTSDTTNLPFIQYCARVQRNSGQTSTGNINFAQGLETVNSIPLVGKTVTLSFYARRGANYSAASNAFKATIYSGTGTDQNPNVAYTGVATVATSTVTLTTTWQRFSFSGTVGTTATEVAAYFEYTPSGTAGAADYFEITGIQLEVGSSATAFSRNAGTIQGELAACQRYYQRWFPVDNVYTIFGTLGTATSTTSISVPFPGTTFRTKPSAVDYSNVIVSPDLIASSLAITNVIVQSASSSNIPYVTCTVSGATQFRPYLMHAGNSLTAYIGLSAEL